MIEQANGADFGEPITFTLFYAVRANVDTYGVKNDRDVLFIPIELYSRMHAGQGQGFVQYVPSFRADFKKRRSQEVVSFQS